MLPLEIAVPNLIILIAAFWSRSIASPQCGQVWTRSERVFLTIIPHREHICDVFLGFTRITREPASSALFSVIAMNRFQATSAMLFARQWFFCIFLIFRSSNTIVPYWSTIRREVW